jgi:hypothetical protein
MRPGISAQASAAWIAVCVTVAPLGCGGPDSTASAQDASSQSDGADSGPSSIDAGPPSDALTRDAGGESSSGDATAPGSCVPAIPSLPWTSPYAGWSNGIPTDPAFFPIAVWLQGSWHATELSQLGVNIYVGNNAGTDAMAVADLATIQKLGMYAILGQDSVGLADIADPTVASTVVGWWMSPDEPDNAQPLAGGGYGPPVSPATLVAQHDAYRAKDPTRPMFLGLGQGVAYDAWEGRGSSAPPESAYVAASDIVAFDIYPYNNCGGDPNEMATCSQFWLNAFGVDRLHQWGAASRNQAVWTDFETTVIQAGTTSGPTPAQTVSEVWLALIHEANGVIYFLDSWNPSFREDAIFANTAMVGAVTALNAQIRSLAPELNSASIPGLVTVTSSNAAAPVDTMVKANGSSLYVFSAVARAGITTASYVIQGMTGDAPASVVGENRTVAVKAGAFSDDLAENGVHIYQIDLAAAKCP